MHRKDVFSHSWGCPKRANPFQYKSLVDGIWIDTSYDPETMTTLRVPFLSADYFALADSRSELGDAFALGQNVIIVVEGVAYEVVGAEDSGDPIVIPELRVDVDQNEDGPDPSSDFTTNMQPENAITLPCPGST